MNLLSTIFIFEWRQLLRQSAMAGSLLFFFVAGCYGIFSGNRVIRHQQVVIDSLRQSYQKDYEAALRAFTADSTAAARKQARYAGLPEMINLRLPQNAVNEPLPLATLSIGQRDVYPYYKRVKTSVSFLDASNVEISNPARLFAGNFDLSFVLVYLLPLLIIGCCYNLLSQEKEQGTYALLLVQGASLHRILLYKLLFRFLLMAGLVFMLSLAGIITVVAHPAVSYMLLWYFIALAWLLFWFAVCYAVTMLKSSSAVNALYLLSAWLLLLIILPSLSNIYVSLKYPAPLRADLASYERHMSEEIWHTNPRQLVDTFNHYNPQYLKTANPAKDTVFSSPRFFAAYYDMLERKVQAKALELETASQQRNQAAEKLSAFNPALRVQQLMNTIAGTGLADYRYFTQQTAVFQKQWKGFLYHYQLAGKPLTPDDFQHFPVFRMQRPSPVSHVLAGSLPLWLAAGLLLLGVSFILRSPTFK